MRYFNITRACVAVVLIMFAVAGTLVAVTFYAGVRENGSPVPAAAPNVVQHDPQPPDGDPGDPAVAKIPLQLIIRVDGATVEEGSNVDAIITLRTEVPDALCDICIPAALSETLGYRIRKTAPREMQPVATFRDLQTVVRKGSPALAPRFTLQGGVAAEFPVLLLDPDPWGGGVFWLEPGTYDVEWMYRTWSHGQVTSSPGDKFIDFDRVLISSPVRVVITAPARERGEAIAAAKNFLQTNPVLAEDSADFLNAYKKVLASGLPPSLEKRVRLHAIDRVWAKLAGRKEANKLIVSEFDTLAKMRLTPGEAETVHCDLARFYADVLDDWPTAAKWARGHTTPWARRFHDWERHNAGVSVN